jgi:hypothetical protein
MNLAFLLLLVKWLVKLLQIYFIFISDCQRPNIHSYEKPAPQHDSFWRSDYCHCGSTRTWHWKFSWYDFLKRYWYLPVSSLIAEQNVEY